MDKKLEWQDLWDAMDNHPDMWIDTTENMYFEMLGVLPPKAMINGNFLVGEPLRHDANGHCVYSCFTKFGDTYKAKNLTVNRFFELFR